MIPPGAAAFSRGAGIGLGDGREVQVGSAVVGHRLRVGARPLEQRQMVALERIADSELATAFDNALVYLRGVLHESRDPENAIRQATEQARQSADALRRCARYGAIRSAVRNPVMPSPAEVSPLMGRS